MQSAWFRWPSRSTMFTERVAPDQNKQVRTLDTEDKRRFFTTLGTFV